MAVHARRLAGPALLALGALLLVLAAVVRFSAYPDVLQLPADPRVTVTATAADARLLDLRTLRGRTTDLTATRVVRAGGGAAPGTVAWEGFLDVVDEDGRTVHASAQRAMLDRRSAAAVPGGQGSVDGEPAEHSGLVWAFPPGTRSRDYPLWDPVLRAVRPARPDGRTVVDGLPALRFVQAVDPVEVGVVEVPGSLVGERATVVRASRLHSVQRTLLVEPQTGTVLRLEERLRSTLAVDGDDRVVLRAWTLVDDEDSVRAAAQRARPQAERLQLVGTTVPLALLLGGLALTAPGLALSLRARSHRYRPRRRRS